MRTTRPDVEGRRGVRLLVTARHLLAGGEVTSRWVMRRFGVSSSAACMDMRYLRLYFPVSVRRDTSAPSDRRSKRMRLAPSALAMA